MHWKDAVAAGVSEERLYLSTRGENPLHHRDAQLSHCVRQSRSSLSTTCPTTSTRIRRAVFGKTTWPTCSTLSLRSTPNRLMVASRTQPGHYRPAGTRPAPDHGPTTGQTACRLTGGTSPPTRIHVGGDVLADLQHRRGRRNAGAVSARPAGDPSRHATRQRQPGPVVEQRGAGQSTARPPEHGKRRPASMPTTSCITWTVCAARLGD
jgi:hypothetical protein